MRRASSLTAPILLALVAFPLAGCGAGLGLSAGPRAERAHEQRWARGFSRVLKNFQAGTKDHERFLIKDERAAKGNVEETQYARLVFMRSLQRLSGETIAALDALGEPPREGRALSDRMRALLKYRLNVARSYAEALMNDDEKRFAALVKKEERELPPLQAAVVAEAKRLEATGR